jgi:ubiquinone biosynthesis protein UbiJ
MAEKKTDPNDLFGQMLGQWESMSNQLANTVMGTPQFGQGQNAAMAATLKIRETMHEQMTRFLEVANMPSREDIVELRAAVAKLDAKLDRIELKLDGAAPEVEKPAAAKTPPRTKRPASAKQAAKDG